MKRSVFLGKSVLVTLPVFLFLAACNSKQNSSSPESVNATNVLGAETNSPEPIGISETQTTGLPGISGKIIFKGEPPAERELPMSADCGKFHTTTPKTRFYVVGENGALADVFVYIKDGLSGKTFAPPTESVLLDQTGCEYTPYVIGLQTGQKLLVRNSDPLMHNVHPIPKISGNKESNKAQMAKSAELQYAFDVPEIFLTFKCDVHPWMYAYVGVVEHPFFAVSGKDGAFQLINVPDGKYVVEAVHRKAGKQTKEISVANGHSAPIEFTFEIPAN